MAKILFNSSE